MRRAFFGRIPNVARAVFGQPWADSLAEQDARLAKLPAGASLLPEKSFAAFQLNGTGGELQTAPVEGQPFARALRVRTKMRPTKPWDLKLIARTTAPPSSAKTARQ